MMSSYIRGISAMSIWTLVGCLFLIIHEYEKTVQVDARLFQPMTRVCLNSTVAAFQSECVDCDSRLYAQTIESCTGKPVLAPSITQAQAFCIVTNCLKVQSSPLIMRFVALAHQASSHTNDVEYNGTKPHQVSTQTYLSRPPLLFGSKYDKWVRLIFISKPMIVNWSRLDDQSESHGNDSYENSKQITSTDVNVEMQIPMTTISPIQLSTEDTKSTTSDKPLVIGIETSNDSRNDPKITRGTPRADNNSSGLLPAPENEDSAGFFDMLSDFLSYLMLRPFGWTSSEEPSKNRTISSSV